GTYCEGHHEKITGKSTPSGPTSKALSLQVRNKISRRATTSMMIVKNGPDNVTLYPMSPHLIYDITQVTPEWLTTVLTRSGALNRGSVTAFETNAGQGNWSRNAVLQLRYSDDAQGERPSSLFLKMVNTDTGDGETFGPSEVHYYTR